MKLCERCPHAVGCGCDYLSTACSLLRKRTCPNVVANNAEVLAAMDANTLAVELLYMIGELFDEGIPPQEEIRDWPLAPYRGGVAL